MTELNAVLKSRSHFLLRRCNNFNSGRRQPVPWQGAGARGDVQGGSLRQLEPRPVGRLLRTVWDGAKAQECRLRGGDEWRCRS